MLYVKVIHTYIILNHHIFVAVEIRQGDLKKIHFNISLFRLCILNKEMC